MLEESGGSGFLPIQAAGRHSDHAIVRTVILPADSEASGQLCIPPPEKGDREKRYLS